MRIESIHQLPRMARRSAAETPAETATSIDRFERQGACQLILPTAADLQVEADPLLWTAPGAARTEHGVTRVELGGGVVRHEYTDGRMTLDGTRRMGQPVHRVRQPDGATSWQIDYPAVMGEMRADLDGVDRQGPSSIDSLQGARALRFAAGPQGNQFTRLEVDGRPAFSICSDGPLSTAVLQNMADAVAQAPQRTFGDVKLIFVLGELGGAADPAGRPTGTVAGFAQYQSQCLYFTRAELETPAGARATMWHEAGHLFDRAHHASDALKDDSQIPVFGYGKLIMEGSKVAVDESDFITRYASTNEQEDFAENHRAALELRATYDAAHPGADLFTLPVSDVTREMSTYSPGIQRRMASVVRLYQEG